VPPLLAGRLRAFFEHSKGLQRAHYQQATLMHMSLRLRGQVTAL
jgi:hypothetical protein